MIHFITSKNPSNPQQPIQQPYVKRTNELPFSYGFPMVFPHGFPMVFPLKPPFSYGFPMVFLWFSLRSKVGHRSHVATTCRYAHTHDSSVDWWALGVLTYAPRHFSIFFWGVESGLTDPFWVQVYIYIIEIYNYYIYI